MSARSTRAVPESAYDPMVSDGMCALTDGSTTFDQMITRVFCWLLAAATAEMRDAARVMLVMLGQRGITRRTLDGIARQVSAAAVTAVIVARLAVDISAMTHPGRPDETPGGHLTRGPTMPPGAASTCRSGPG